MDPKQEIILSKWFLTTVCCRYCPDEKMHAFSLKNLVNKSKVNRWIYVALYCKPFISKSWGLWIVSTLVMWLLHHCVTHDVTGQVRHQRASRSTRWPSCCFTQTTAETQSTWLARTTVAITSSSSHTPNTRERYRLIPCAGWHFHSFWSRCCILWWTDR